MKTAVLLVILSVVSQCKGHLLAGLLGDAHKHVHQTIEGVAGAALGGFNFNLQAQAGANKYQRPQPPPQQETIVVVVEDDKQGHPGYGHNNQGYQGQWNGNQNHYGNNHRPHGHNQYGQQNGYGQNGQQNGYGQNGQQNGYGQNGQQNGYGQNGQQNGYGQNVQQNGYGQNGHGHNHHGHNNNYGRPDRPNNYGQNNFEQRPEQSTQGQHNNGYNNGYNNNLGYNNNGGYNNNNFGNADNNYGNNDQGQQQPPSERPNQGYYGQQTTNKPENKPSTFGTIQEIPTKDPYEHSTMKPDKEKDEPLFVPLNPNEYVYGGDKITISGPKRETENKDAADDDDLPIDIRFQNRSN